MGANSLSIAVWHVMGLCNLFGLSLGVSNGRFRGVPLSNVCLDYDAMRLLSIIDRFLWGFLFFIVPFVPFAGHLDFIPSVFDNFFFL